MLLTSTHSLVNADFVCEIMNPLVLGGNQSWLVVQALINYVRVPGNSRNSLFLIVVSWVFG